MNNFNSSSTDTNYNAYNCYYNHSYRYIPKEIKEVNKFGEVKLEKPKEEKVHMFNIKDLYLKEE